MKYKHYIIVLLICSSTLTFGQQSNYDIQYKNLKELYKNSKLDSLKEFYAKKYLARAKKHNDKIKIADGFKFLALIHYPDSLSFRYADSIIQLTKGIKNKNYPVFGYITKGNIYYELGDYEKSIDNPLCI